MRVILVRHAIALDREDWNFVGKPDGTRPLSEQGIERFERGAKGIAKLIPDPTVIVTSPLTRARQTAEILAKAYKSLDIVESDSLTPGGSEGKLLSVLHGYPDKSDIFLTGHEPDMSYLLSLFLVANSNLDIQFKKGAAASIVFSSKASFGEGVLEWFIPPKVLRAYSS